MKTNIIYNEDCIKGLKKIPDNSVDLVLTDPPYQFESEDAKGLIGGGFMSNENKKNLIEINSSWGIKFKPIDILNEFKRVLRIFNLYVFTNKSLLFDYISFAKKNNYSFDILLWLKPNPLPLNNNHYLIDKEYIVYIREKGAIFNSDLGYMNYFSYFNHPIGERKFNHPTVKPIKLIRRFITISSNRGNIILDPFLGSGTTAVACKQLNRQYIGFEIDKEYVEIANKRLKQETLLRKYPEKPKQTQNNHRVIQNNKHSQNTYFAKQN